jgi:hypothetical protein
MYEWFEQKFVMLGAVFIGLLAVGYSLAPIWI